MQLSHFILTLSVILIWGFNFIIIKAGLEEISPTLLAFTRFFLTSIPAIFFIKKPDIPFKMILGYGLGTFALPFGLLFLAMDIGITPGLASLLLQLQVFFTLFLSLIFLGEKLHRWQIVGALVSFTGIALAAMNLQGNVTLTGFILILFGAASWGFGNIIAKKIGKVNQVSLVTWGSLAVWPPFLILSFLLEGKEQVLDTFSSLSGSTYGAILFIAYPATLFGFAVWSWLLQRYPMGTIAPFMLLIPIIGMLSSIFFYGEPFPLWKIFAGLLVVTGLFINVLGPKIFKKTKKPSINSITQN